MADEQKSALTSTREIAERGEAIYKEKWEEKLSKESPGKFVVINISNGDAAIGDTSEEALRLAQDRYDAGLGSIVELNEAQLNETSAEMTAADATYTCLSRRASASTCQLRPGGVAHCNCTS